MVEDADSANSHRAEFRFYAELNDFLAPTLRHSRIDYLFSGNPGIKDPIEALGVPHTEVELIVVDGNSRGFDYQLQHGDRVAVYPVFECFDVSPLVRLRQAPLRRTAFVVDVHLGKLARLLRLLGFDVLYRNDLEDREIVNISCSQRRIVLTRDRRLLYNKRITHGCFIRADRPLQQVQEVVRRLQLESAINPFHRCLLCNGEVMPVAREAVLDQLPAKTARYYQDFHRCRSCGKIYWQGPHYRHLQQQLQAIRNDLP